LQSTISRLDTPRIGLPAGARAQLGDADDPVAEPRQALAVLAQVAAQRLAGEPAHVAGVRRGIQQTTTRAEGSRRCSPSREGGRPGTVFRLAPLFFFM
jgi:hypothetical protein